MWSGSNNTPGRVNMTNLNLTSLIMQAYGVRRFQINGPDWLDQQRFDISAKIPDGVPRSQVNLMLQSLLEERFGLKFHRESKEAPIYELVIAKDGPKLKEAADSPDSQPTGPPAVRPQIKPGKDGFPEFPPEMKTGSMALNNRIRSRSIATLDQFVNGIANQVGRPVKNATGLTARYEIDIHYVMDLPNVPHLASSDPNEAADPDGPTIFAALEDQLGLRLEPKRGSVETLVIDHVEKTPSEN
jgi:uncharacterized protein (TIGR03435 family)